MDLENAVHGVRGAIATLSMLGTCVKIKYLKEQLQLIKEITMVTKLIQLDDGTLVEIEVPGDQVQQISGGFAEQVNSTFDKIQPILVKICKPIAVAWQEINKEMNIEQAEVQLGLSFEGEGNLYITKSKANANLTVKLVLKSKGNEK
jgi:hypothetical protein